MVYGALGVTFFHVAKRVVEVFSYGSENVTILHHLMMDFNALETLYSQQRAMIILAKVSLVLCK